MCRSFAKIGLATVAMIAANALIAEFSPALSAERAPVEDTRSPDPALVKPGTYMIDPHHGRIVWTVLHNGYSHLAILLPLIDATLTIDPANIANSKLTATVHM